MNVQEVTEEYRNKADKEHWGGFQEGK